MSYPSNWTKTKFSEIAGRKSVRVNNPCESGYDRYVGLEHLDSGELVVKRWGSTKDVKSNMQLFSKNDILFARRNTYLKRVSVALFDGVCSGDIIVIKPISKHVVSGFLPIYMQFERFENRIIAWSAGAFSKRVKWKQLSNFEVYLPSKEQQQKIVDIIWGIQAHQEKTGNLIRVTENLKRGLLEKLLIKGIGHEKFRKTDLGEIPEEWEISRLDDCAYIKGRIGWKGLKSSEYTKTGPFLIALQHITKQKIVWELCAHISEFRYEESPEIKLKAKDIVMSKDGVHAGEIAFVDYLPGKSTINSTMMLIRAISSKLEPRFLFYFLQGSQFRNFVNAKTSGSAVPHIFQRDMKELLICIPREKEQKRIVDILERTDQLISDLYNNINNISTLKKKLVNSLLSGELSISKDDII